MLSISDNTQAYVYNTRNSTDNCDNPGCYSYYSWHAATAGSGVDITTANTDAPYSICPKGWKLPNTKPSTNSSTDFRALVIAYGGLDSIATYDETTSPTGADLFGKIGPGTTAFFCSRVLTGITGLPLLQTIFLPKCYVSAGHIYSADTGFYKNSFAIRCLAR